MTGTQTLVARAALGAFAATASVVLAISPRLQSVSRRTFDRLVFAALVLSRVGLFVLIFLVLRVEPRGDIQGFYFPQAVQVLARHVPYRDFVTSYAPLHPYLDAIFVRLWRTPLSIMLLSVLVELATLPLWMRVGRSFLREGEVRVAALLYLASPISVQFVVVDGQDNVLIALLIGLSLLLVLRRRALLSGVVLGVSVALVKFLPLLYAPAYFLAVPRRWRWAAGMAATVTLVYGSFLLLHAPILQPLQAEGELRSAGNLPYLVESLFGVSVPGRVSDVFLLVVLGGIFGCIARAAFRASPEARIRILAFGACALTLALLLLAKKSWPPYLMLSLFPLCVLPLSARHDRRSATRIVVFAVFSFIAVTEHSVWASLLGMFPSPGFHAAMQNGNPVAFLFLGLQILLLAGYVWLLYEALREVMAAASVVEGAAPGRESFSSASPGRS